LVLGKQDSFYQEEMRILDQKISHSIFIELDECGHMIPLEQPQKVTELLINWVKS
jgi:pimeloyl-ACP methyl ester carboxylesterase